MCSIRGRGRYGQRGEGKRKDASCDRVVQKARSHLSRFQDLVRPAAKTSIRGSPKSNAWQDDIGEQNTDARSSWNGEQ